MGRPHQGERRLDGVTSASRNASGVFPSSVAKMRKSETSDLWRESALSLWERGK